MKIDRFVSCLSLLTATVGAAACAAPEEDFFPSSCEELRDHHRDSGETEVLLDVEYPLFVGNDPARGWRAHCDGMRSAAPPKEYLVLHRTGGSFNYSEIAQPGLGGVRSSLRMEYAMLRIDPATLMIDVSDTAHGKSDGEPVALDGDDIAALPLGVAIACGDQVATANLDLSETGLQLAAGVDAASAFCLPDDDEATTVAVISEPDRGSVAIAVAPNDLPDDTCTWVTPKPCNRTPWREGAMTGTALQLELRTEIDTL